MAQYSNKSILKALFLAPSMSLVVLVTFFLFMNHQYDVQSLLTLFGISLMIYLIYCVIVIPIAYALSLWLAHQYWLNFFSIFFGSILMWLIVSIIGYLIFTGSLPTPIWKLFSDWFFYAISIFSGCCYWGFLKLFSSQPKLDQNNLEKTDA